MTPYLHGNRIDLRSAGVHAGNVIGTSLIRRIRGIIVSALIMLFWTVAALAADAPPDSRLAEDIALTKSTISSLAANDFATVRDRLDPKMGKISDDKFRPLADMIGAGEPISIETIWARETHEVQTGDGNSRMLLEYALNGKWVLVDAVVKTESNTKRLTRLYLTPNIMPLKELNAFHLFGKGVVQYLFLAGWIAVILITALAMVIAFRHHRGWRRWLLIVLMPAGLTPSLAVNWNTAQISVLEAVSNAAGQAIPIVAFRYPMALYGYTETLVPYLYISAPLVAFGYLIWYWGWGQRRAQLASA